VVKPFGAKGVAISLREFTIAALNQHHGIQAVERFGWERTGRRDFDEDGVIDEFSAGQVSALTLFQALLPPLERAPATTPDLRRGRRLFEQVACAECHRPYLSLRVRTFTEPGSYNRPGAAVPEDLGGVMEMPLPTGTRESGIQRLPDGTLRVWAYTDLRRHRICDAEDPFFCNEKLRQDNVATDQFMTSKLWDLAQSSPYGHRGDCDTVSEVILHHAGEARPSRQRFAALADDEKKSLIAFLLSLGSRPRERTF
jgi:cytochrome c peroxidase